MTTLEIVLCFVSVTETIITVVLHRKMKKKLDKESEVAVVFDVSTTKKGVK